MKLDGSKGTPNLATEVDCTHGSLGLTPAEQTWAGTGQRQGHLEIKETEFCHINDINLSCSIQIIEEIK